MRRIFTFSLFAAALVVASFNSFGQDCSPTQPNPGVCSGTVAENFSSGAGGFTASGTAPFTLASGTWSATTTGNSNSFTSIMTSSSYFKTSNMPNAVTAGFSTSAGDHVTITSVKLEILSDGNALLASCSQTLNLTNSSGTVCISIFNPNIVSGQYIKYRFTVNSTTGNGSGNRVITFDNFSYGGNSNAALPVKFQSLDARMNNSAVSLKWNIATEENLSGYEIEKGTDGKNYSKIGFVAASGQASYSFVDSKPASITYYRIKSVDINGRFSYSTVALVKAGKSLIVLKAFPTPFIKNISIQHGTATGRSLITISSEDGRTIKTIVPAVGTQQTDVDLSAAKAGMYLVRFTDDNGQTETLKILKQQ